MAKKTKQNEEVLVESIVNTALDDVMAERFATYAKYVIQDRAIPDVRDGLKPVQRRILYAMADSGNVFEKPTRKCAHTVGEVMGKYHPHGDSSIYSALARMSQTWKVRVPLIDFQGNNGSIDGDEPAAYRYTEARLGEITNELIRDLDKKTVDMQFTFDDSSLEPVVLPARFPNLLVNGSEGIAVGVATNIPPHNLGEIIEATIYRLGHRNASIEDVMQFVKGPDFPTGGVIYQSEGLESIYKTGRGRIEIAAKTEIVYEKTINQIIVHEIPYGVNKSQLVYEIDKIRFEKTVDGILEVRDESDREGLRIAIDLKKDAKEDIVLSYLYNKTKLRTSFSANMVAIVNARPKTLNLLDFVDAYIAHQVDVITRRSRFDLEKKMQRSHIVEGLIKAISIVDEVVKTIRASKDKADSKQALMQKFGFTEPQSEAIVMMQLYKLSNTDITILEQEKANLDAEICELNAILSDDKKLDRVIINDLKAIKTKYDTPRLTQIGENTEIKQIDKRDLIAKEDVMLVVTRDGYIKRCSLKSHKSSDGALPGIKDGDSLVGYSEVNTIDYLLAFTNLGNYCYVPIHEILEGKWKEEGKHINYLVSLNPEEKIVKAIVTSVFREDISLSIITKNGQIKKTMLNEFVATRYSKPINCMKLLRGDEVVDVATTTGDSDLLIITKNGNATFFNENEISATGLKSAGVKAISSLKNGDAIVSMNAYEPNEKGKLILITDGGCERVFDISHLIVTARLGRMQCVYKCFKSEPHALVYVLKVARNAEKEVVYLLLNTKQVYSIDVTDFRPVPSDKYAKKNLDIGKDELITFGYYHEITCISEKSKTYKPLNKAPIVMKKSETKEDDENSVYEQISIFDDLGD